MTVQPGRPSTSIRGDWLLAALSVWLIGGFYVDIWAHAHGEVDDTFLTQWHALLYSGAASFGVATGALAVLGRSRGAPLRDVLPGPYRQSFVGAVVFAVGGIFDLAWHTAVGFEVDVEALLSPSHLILAAGGLLMVGGPVRSVAARLVGQPASARSWGSAGPLVVALAMGSAVLIAFTQYANPVVDAWASAMPERAEPVAQLVAASPNEPDQVRLTFSELDTRSGSLSPDGDWLLYTAGDDQSAQIRVARLDRSEDRPLTTEGSSFRPAWSPDGTRILFARARDDGDGGGDTDLFVMRADGTDVRRLTVDAGEDWAGAWSPDGSRIVFNSNRSGTYDLYVMAADGSGQAALTSGPDDDFEPAWSPDGTRLAFTSNRADGEFGIWLMDADGGEPVRLSTGDGNAYMPTWSPDGSALAFTSSRTGDFEVFVVPATGGEAANISRNPGGDDGWVAPAWAPDGSVIIYPSEGSAPWWQDPYVREGFGAAGVLVLGTLLAGVVAFSRRWRLPIGAYTVLVGVPASMVTVISDEYRFIPAAVVAGMFADVVALRWPAGKSRLGDALVAFLVPVGLFAAYFGAMALTTGIGWSLHLWLGAIFTAGVIGLFIDELARRPRSASS